MGVAVADSSGNTPLGAALRGGYGDTAQALLQGGAITNTQVRSCL